MIYEWSVRINTNRPFPFFFFFFARQVLGPMHCPTTLVVNDRQTEYPLPEPSLPLNFTNSTGLRYEADEVRQCLLQGRSRSKGSCASRLQVDDIIV